VNELKAWAGNPQHARLTTATVESLLRWTNNRSNWKANAPHAFDVWIYLFGAPAPTWKEWNDSERKYEFDVHGWQRWFQSLNETGG
jgi:hypothetical protein